MLRWLTGAEEAGLHAGKGRNAIGKTITASGTGLAAIPMGQSWQCPSCSRLAWSPGACIVPGLAVFFMPELVQISAMTGDLFTREAASAGSAILNRTANNTDQTIGNRDFLVGNI